MKNMNKQVGLPKLANAIKANVCTHETSSSNFVSSSREEASMPKALMMYFMLQEKYSKQSIQDELGVTDKGMTATENYLFSSVENGTKEFMVKIRLIKNYLRLN